MINYLGILGKKVRIGLEVRKNEAVPVKGV